MILATLEMSLTDIEWITKAPVNFFTTAQLLGLQTHVAHSLTVTATFDCPNCVLLTKYTVRDIT